MTFIAEANSKGGSGWVRATARYTGSNDTYNFWTVKAFGPDHVRIAIQVDYTANFGVDAPQVAQGYADRIYDEITQVPPME